MIDPTKRYVSRGKRMPYVHGRNDVRDRMGYTLNGWFIEPDGHELPVCHSPEGRFNVSAVVPHELDLIADEDVS